MQEQLNKPSGHFFWLALASSTTTLVCCALPALFIAIGAGASLAALVSAVPQLVWISQFKEYFFGVTALLLLGGGYFLLKPQSCPADKELALACAKSKRLSKALYVSSVLIFCLGAWAAFLR